MEQHTWPRGSSCQAFSAISSSDYGSNRHHHGKQHHTLRKDHGSQHSMYRKDHREIEAMKTERVSSSIPSSCGDESSLHGFHRDRNSIRYDREQERRHFSSVSDCMPYCGKSPRPERAFWSEPSAPFSNGKLCYLSTNMLPAPPAIQEASADFAQLPDDVLRRIAGSLSWPNLCSASRVCRSWNVALAPLREAMLLVHWGKKFKHGRGGVTRNLDKALDSFLKGASRGCAAAMVDAGLLLWELGRRQEGVLWYQQAAELGDPAGQCNLGLAYLQEPSNPTEAVKWFQRAAIAGHVRAQYSLALCLQQGKGMECSTVKAARWYQRAAEGGSAKAMYNLALCYRKGEGLNPDLREARKWMKRAACAGHRKAQFEHGLTLFAESDGVLALVFLELATRAGETAATHLRDALLQQLSPKARAYAIAYADRMQAKLNGRS